MNEKQVEGAIDQYGPVVFRFCLALTKDRYLGEELYQDTFLHLLSRRESVDHRDNVKGYLCSVAARAWKDRKRKFARRRNIAPFVFDEGAGEKIPDERTPERALLERERKKDLDRALSELPEAQREVILLKYLGECSLEEISRLTGIPEGTVKSRLYYGKEKLRERLEEMGYGKT